MILQCGHGEFAVENGCAPRNTTATAWSLQCGHGEFAVENGGGTSVGRVNNADLQCGHGEFAVENPAADGQSMLWKLAFNAATANSPWRTTTNRRRTDCNKFTFNAATA